jgi:hypothetical protein
MPTPHLPFPGDLDGLVANMVTFAERDAAAARTAAAAAAHHTAQAAEAEAQTVLEGARRTGARAAARTAAGRRAESRRQARELILATRRRLLDRLRAESVALVAAELVEPRGKELRRYLDTLVGEAAGTPHVEESRTARGWRVTAPTSRGRAELDLPDLVDQIIGWLGEDVDSLWQ